MPASSPAFKYHQNDLFRSGTNYKLNACVGENGGPYTYLDYSRGYFMAANNQLSSILNDSAYIDILIYPLCYTYRHAIELSLKYLAKVLPLVLETNSEIKQTHKLDDNWQIIRPGITALRHRLNKDLANVEFVDKILADFLSIDPTAEIFRFPENKKGNLHLQHISLINVEVLGSQMHHLSSVFSEWFGDVDYLIDHD